MTPTPGAFLRVGGLLLAAVIIQLSGLGQIRILGGHFDLVPLVVAGVAYYAGSVPGAATGFGAGFLLDLLAGQTMGASSLVLCAVGYGVGRLRELRDPAHGLLPIAVGAAAAAGWVLAFARRVVHARRGGRQRERAGLPRHARDRDPRHADRPARVRAGAARDPALLAVDPLERRRRRQSPRESGPLGLRGMEV